MEWWEILIIVISSIILLYVIYIVFFKQWYSSYSYRSSGLTEERDIRGTPYDPTSPINDIDAGGSWVNDRNMNY